MKLVQEELFATEVEITGKVVCTFDASPAGEGGYLLLPVGPGRRARGMPT
jgi:hypothetical protein